MARRYTRKRRRKKGRGKTKKQKEIDDVWAAFKKGRKDAKHAAFMKANPLPVLTVDKAFKQPNLPQTQLRTVSDDEIKGLTHNLENIMVGRHIDLTLPGQKFPRRGGKKRKRKRRRTKRKRKRRRKKSRKRRR